MYILKIKNSFQGNSCKHTHESWYMAMNLHCFDFFPPLHSPFWPREEWAFSISFCTLLTLGAGKHKQGERLRHWNKSSLPGAIERAGLPTLVEPTSSRSPIGKTQKHLFLKQVSKNSTKAFGLIPSGHWIGLWINPFWPFSASDKHPTWVPFLSMHLIQGKNGRDYKRHVNNSVRCNRGREQVTRPSAFPFPRLFIAMRNASGSEVLLMDLTF